MKLILEAWRGFLQEKDERDPQDSSKVAKIVLVDSNKKVLFLKRTNYMKKFAGEWDLPGGHVHIGESLKDGLVREVEEETGLSIKRCRLYTRLDNLYFFEGVYEQGSIVLSNEHSEYEFRDVSELENPSKFEKIAQMVVSDGKL